MEKLLGNLAVILVRPKYPENIGAAARIAHNLGISRFIIVTQSEHDRGKVLMMATHNARSLIESMEVYATLDQALSGFSYVVAATARGGRRRRIMTKPREMVPLVVSKLGQNKTALLFGPEDRGLENDDLKAANLLVSIPTSEFSSLNLAQAVGIICYEIYYGILHNNGGPKIFSPKRATVFEMEGMYSHLEKVLYRIGFLKKDENNYWMGSIRNFLGRIDLRAREAKIIRGICRQFLCLDDSKRRVEHPDQKE